jgi:predicted membrane chloride channel (bestrophin family)
MKLSALFALTLVGFVDAFVPQSVQTTTPSVETSSTALSAGPPDTATKDIPYGETSRQFRRTVYTHDDWVKHRSPNRFVKNIFSLVNSGIYKNVSREVSATTTVATIVFLWNMLTVGYDDLSQIHHAPLIDSYYVPGLTLPMNPFTLASGSLGLLLVFRTNTAYQRWDEARKNWGMNINHTRDLVRMGNAFYDGSQVSPEERQADLQRLSVCTWAFVRAMKRHLSPEWEDEAAFRLELYERLPESQANAIINAAHRPNRALFDLSMAIENLPMHFMRKNEMHKALTIFEDNLGSSERLLTSPVPLIYNRHTARFLSFWLLLMPLALYKPFESTWNHVGMIPATAMISLFLFGIEELATQMEEPFTILPMQAFCDKIGNWCNEIVSWEDGDNGITTNKSYQGHKEVYFENLGSSPGVVDGNDSNAFIAQPEMANNGWGP